MFPIPDLKVLPLSVARMETMNRFTGLVIWLQLLGSSLQAIAKKIKIVAS